MNCPLLREMCGRCAHGERQSKFAMVKNLNFIADWTHCKRQDAILLAQ